MFQGVADDPGNYDLEACGELLNPEEVRGKICVVTRGSCFFSSKTLACQRAGAVAAIIVNDAMDEGAADNWVTSHDPAGILIPTVSYGAVQGNQLLREMDTSAAVTHIRRVPRGGRLKIDRLQQPRDVRRGSRERTRVRVHV